VVTKERAMNLTSAKRISPTLIILLTLMFIIILINAEVKKGKVAPELN
jgi:hypothetical protein